ncbi:DNA primase [Candidatus Daviesbacteria bacterium RIFCSPLOWO2_01_FULL_39_12]|uniref:DNA primase n=1 Tax=Candidatus Daviesbacteria bacterium RIFCSPLOWO2_01_FULL_39_12 TaxID=1797785 RepID=A0A1F5KTJ4_9BACT|nr:MAG: DNA primase [Candidatus Daviesbacteria bacterium RIFCSPLOWO2_01_FULL_39_12]
MDDKDLIKEKINIVDLISEYLPLKKSGVNFKANCPLHNEKTPSFIVSPQRQIFRCFGCGKGGDVFTFLMEKEGMDFKESLEFLAKKAGITLKRHPEKKDFKDRLFEANLKAQEFFHYLLISHQLGKKALDYLKKRGITDETIEQFGLGYAPNSWESLSKFLVKKGFSVSEIVTAGLAVASTRGCYDRFRGRITFPLIDAKENLRGFSGRVLYPAEPKYINTPQTPIFDKGSFLFGINLAKSEIRNKKEAVLVEGEMDVILSYQVGFKNVVASKGTSLTEGQIEQIKRYTDTVLLCFDMDLAGDNASLRGIEMFEKALLNIKVIQLQEGKDAAEAIRGDIKVWQKAVDEAVPIYDYYLASVSKRYNINDPRDLKQVGAELIPVWAKIANDLIRDHYIQKLAAFIKTDETVVREIVNKTRIAGGRILSEIFKKIDQDDQILSPKTRRELLEEYLIALLLHPPQQSNFVPSFPETLLLKETWRQVYVMLVLYLDSISFKSTSFNINEFAKGMPKELLSEIDRLYLTELDEKLTDSKHWQKEVEGVVSELKKALIKASLEKLSYEIKNAQSFGKMEVLESLNKRFRDLSVKLKNL